MGKYSKKRRRPSLLFPLLLGVLIVGAGLYILSSRPQVQETDEVTYGIDVARYQGTIDWNQVAAGDVDFVMVRLGYRAQADGRITADANAAYNLQQARDAGLKLGAYFFSTAVTKEEAIEEANWVADFLDPYPITYPVAYNCEGFSEPDSRQYLLTKHQRTEIALEFLRQLQKRGYEPMFYASRNEMTDDTHWQVSRIDPEFKIWVAQYPENPDPINGKSSYEGIHQMWQYTREGTIPGISQPVDLDVAYFGYDGVKAPKSKEEPAPATPDAEALMDFREVREHVTAKEETNLRNIPGQGADSQVLYTLQNGEIALRTGISDSGWSRVEYQGGVFYAVSSYLTTDLDSNPAPAEDDGIDTEFRPVSDSVTAKDVVNLRSIPSYTREDSQVVAQLKKGEIIRRTGINEDVGWSRVEWNGQTLYCITSYLEVVE